VRYDPSRKLFLPEIPPARQKEIQLSVPDQAELKRFHTRSHGATLCVGYGDPAGLLCEEVPEPLEYSDNFSALATKGYWFIAVPDPGAQDWSQPNYTNCFMRHDVVDPLGNLEIAYMGPLEVCWIDVPKQLNF